MHAAVPYAAAGGALEHTEQRQDDDQRQRDADKPENDGHF
jgi:hypothetical protein